MTIDEKALQKADEHFHLITGHSIAWSANVPRKIIEAYLSALPPSPGQEQAAGPLADLVARFSEALLAKLRDAQQKYGYDGWVRDDWADELRLHLRQHVEKGDPRDVAAYCAFAWHHGWSLAQPAPSPATAEVFIDGWFDRELQRRIALGWKWPCTEPPATPAQEV